MAETREARPVTGTQVREGDGFGVARFGISTFSGNIVGYRNTREAKPDAGESLETRSTPTITLEARTPA